METRQKRKEKIPESIKGCRRANAVVKLNGKIASSCLFFQTEEDTLVQVLVTDHWSDKVSISNHILHKVHNPFLATTYI